MGHTAIKADGLLDIQTVILYGWAAELISGEMGIGVDVILLSREHQDLESTTRQLAHESQMPSQLPPLSPDFVITDLHLRHISSTDPTSRSVGDDDEPNISPHQYSPSPTPSHRGPSHTYNTTSDDHGLLYVPLPSDSVAATSNSYSNWSDEYPSSSLSMWAEPKWSAQPDPGATTMSDSDNKGVAPPFGYEYQPYRPQLFHSAADDLTATKDQRRDDVIGNYQSRGIKPYGSPVTSGSGSSSDMTSLNRGAQHATDDTKTEMPMHTPLWQSSPFDVIQQSAPGGNKRKTNANANDTENGNNLRSRASEIESAGEASRRPKPKGSFEKPSASARDVARSPFSLAGSSALASDQGDGVLPPMFDIYGAISTASVIASSATNEGRVVGDEISTSSLAYRGARTMKRERDSEGEAEGESIKRARIGGDIGDEDSIPSYYRYY